MHSPNEVVVIGIGLVTPLGVGWAQTATAVRAGVSAYREVVWGDAFFPPTVMATLPDEVLPEAPRRGEAAGDQAATEAEHRLARLAALALQTLGENRAGRSMPLVLGLPGARELCGYQPVTVMKMLYKLSGGWVDGANSRTICKGRASGLLAVQEARAWLQSGAAELVLAGGCDTHLNMARVEALDEAGRLNTEQNMDGFVPGEGTGILLLTTRGKARALGAEPICTLAGAAAGFETGHLGSAEPYRGEGLASTWQELLRSSGGPPIRSAFSSMNGEHHWAKELGTACIRCKDRLAGDLVVEHPADCYGDLGAASGPALMALAAWGLYRGHMSGPALASCSSDLGEQCAVLVNRASD